MFDFTKKGSRNEYRGNILEECETDLQMQATVTSLFYDRSHSLYLIEHHVQTLDRNIGVSSQLNSESNSEYNLI